MGYVAEIFTQDALATLPGHAAIGHTRYSTAGESSVANAQPLLIDCVHGQVGICHNGNIVNARELREDLVREGSIFQTNSDTEVALHLFARSKAASVEDALVEAIAQLTGAFSFALLTKERLVAVRDPHGFRPLALGRLGDGWVVCSETCAMDLVGATYVRDVEPGEVLIIGPDGAAVGAAVPAGAERPLHLRARLLRPSRQRGVRPQRQRGRAPSSAASSPARPPSPADVIVPIPDSGVCAAIGYAEQSGIPIRFGLIRNHYVGRTFIEPAQSIRHFGVKVKLNPVRSLLKGKRVVLIDDSIVRGTTSRKIVKMVRGAGAAEVHVRISCPPTVSPCFYGVDTPQRSELIAATHSIDEIRKYLEADSVAYLSLEGLLSAVTPESGRYCTSCYTGQYPVAFPRDQQAYLQLALKLDGRPAQVAEAEPVA